MQDRYLFRGKSMQETKNGAIHPDDRIAIGQWVFGGVHRKDDEVFVVQEGTGYYCDWVFRARFIKVDPATVGPCTGLYDMNEALIYKGDIVSIRKNEFIPHPDLGIKGVVCFGHYRHSDAALDYVCGDYGFYLLWRTNKLLRVDMMYWQGNNYLEVIGNIHDNPELLEVDRPCEPS